MNTASKLQREIHGSVIHPSGDVSTGGGYTCPMHPQMRLPVPGACPICGMALEPVLDLGDGAAMAESQGESVAMSRRLWIGAVLTLPVFMLSMGQHSSMASQTSNWIQLTLGTLVVWWAGWPFFELAAASVRNRSLNMFSLVALGTGVSWLYSVVATLAPDVFPEGSRRRDGAVPGYFEAASMITVLVLLGQVIELRARARTSGAIRALLDLTPRHAVRLRSDGSDETVALAAVRVGDLLRVKPGESLPVDGVVTGGSGHVDESMMTGEPSPVLKNLGSKMTAGTLNQTASFVIRAEKVGGDTLVAQIVRMVAVAQRTRAPIQQSVDRIAGWFVPIVIGLSLLTFLAWTVWGPAPTFARALFSAVSVLIIACPCALGLATPMAVMIGIGRGAGAGILIRDAEALQRMEKVDTLVVDKTGTLTEGHPRVVHCEAADGFDVEILVRRLAAVEISSEHPIAGAVMLEAQRLGLVVSPAVDFESITGRGVKGTVDGTVVHAGNTAFMAKSGFDIALVDAKAAGDLARGATVIHVAVDKRLAGFVAVADPLKPTTAAAIDLLRKQRIRVIMLTGDARITAEAVGRELGIDEVIADVLPQDKAAAVTRLMAAGRVVAMAGDGVNDAPALAAADVGIAMDAGSDVAIESAGITLLRGDLNGILGARRLSRLTMRNIRTNLGFAFAYNALGIPIAAGVLYPSFGIVLSPAWAAGAMALSSFSVIANSMRLRAISLSE